MLPFTPSLVKNLQNVVSSLFLSSFYIYTTENCFPSKATRILTADVVSDAMGIYTTYVALNALTPIHVPDNIRQRVEGLFVTAAV